MQYNSCARGRDFGKGWASARNEQELEKLAKNEETEVKIKIIDAKAE